MGLVKTLKIKAIRSPCKYGSAWTRLSKRDLDAKVSLVQRQVTSDDEFGVARAFTHLVGKSKAEELISKGKLTADQRPAKRSLEGGRSGPSTKKRRAGGDDEVEVLTDLPMSTSVIEINSSDDGW
jgi:hypothetical protein